MHNYATEPGRYFCTKLSCSIAIETIVLIALWLPTSSSAGTATHLERQRLMRRHCCEMCMPYALRYGISSIGKARDTRLDLSACSREETSSLIVTFPQT